MGRESGSARNFVSEFYDAPTARKSTHSPRTHVIMQCLTAMTSFVFIMEKGFQKSRADAPRRQVWRQQDRGKDLEEQRLRR